MSSRPAAHIDDLDALNALADPVRRKLYEHIVGAGRPVGRDEAAAAAGISRSLAAYHLDKLGDAGLLETAYARPPGRRGPGAGRPAKLYRRSEREFVLHTPPRDYALLAEIFLRAEEDDTAARTAVERSALEVGKELGRTTTAAEVEDVLRRRGYEPFDDDGTIRFRNCPFHALAEQHRDSVCAVNLALVQGILAGAGSSATRASLEPDRAGCCVAITPARGSAAPGS
jgi:predicted ArsR family transcriptional regulator